MTDTPEALWTAFAKSEWRATIIPGLTLCLD